jgi:hypothetical protein
VPVAGPQSVCVLLDASGSMYLRRRGLIDAANRLLKALPAEDEVCVADFSWRLHVDQRLTENRQLDVEALSYIRSSGGSAVRSSLAELSNDMRTTARHASRAIILLSDGTDNASNIDEDQMKKEIESMGGVAVHVICLPPDPGANMEGQDRVDKKAALHLTSIFGGLGYFPHNTIDTEESVDHLVGALKSRYMLAYQALNTGRDGRSRQITIEFDKAHQKMRAVVRVPEGYYAPSE